MPSTNEIGDLGESIFKVAITKDYIFSPVMLGEKWPASDFYVELRGQGEKMHFIVQVKSTEQPIDANNFLPITATLLKLQELNKYHCPTYLAAVNVKTDIVYMVAVNGNISQAIGKMPTTFELNTANRQKLYKDVELFWNGSGMKTYKHNFNHTI